MANCISMRRPQAVIQKHEQIFRILLIREKEKEEK